MRLQCSTFHVDGAGPAGSLNPSTPRITRLFAEELPSLPLFEYPRVARYSVATFAQFLQSFSRPHRSDAVSPGSPERATLRGSLRHARQRNSEGRRDAHGVPSQRRPARRLGRLGGRGLFGHKW